MLYHPGQWAEYAVGAEINLRSYQTKSSSGFVALTTSGNAPELAHLPRQTAVGLSAAMDRSFPTHSGGKWRLLLSDLSDEQLVLLGEWAGLNDRLIADHSWKWDIA